MGQAVTITSMEIAAFDAAGAWERALAAMPSWRREKVERLRGEQARRLSLAVGMLLDEALQGVGRRLATTEVVFGEQGKPRFREAGLFRFSATHSGTTAMLATCAGEVGMDFEAFGRRARARGDALLKRIAGDEEVAFVRAGGGEVEREVRFLRLWTAKEAYLKWLGAGLTVDPREVVVELGEGMAARVAGHPEVRLGVEVLAQGVRAVCTGR